MSFSCKSKKHPRPTQIRQLACVRGESIRSPNLEEEIKLFQSRPFVLSLSFLLPSSSQAFLTSTWTSLRQICKFNLTVAASSFPAQRIANEMDDLPEECHWIVVEELERLSDWSFVDRKGKVFANDVDRASFWQ